MGDDTKKKVSPIIQCSMILPSSSVTSSGNCLKQFTSIIMYKELFSRRRLTTVVLAQVVKASIHKISKNCAKFFRLLGKC